MLYIFLSELPLSVKSFEFQYGKKLFHKTTLPPFTSFSILSLITIAPRNSTTPTTKNNNPIITLDASIFLCLDIHITPVLSGVFFTSALANC